MTETPPDSSWLSGLLDWSVSLMDVIGPAGAGLAIALENLFPPLPSEVVLPMAGLAASNGSFTLFEALAWTTAGSIVGAFLLYGLGAWREAPYYSERERAGLEWTEALTNVTDGHVPDAVYDAARAHFSDKELVDLTWAVAAINAWNRVAIAFRSEAGSYRAPTAHRT